MADYLAAHAGDGLTVPIMLAVLGAAVLHALWNSIAHVISDRLVGFGLIGLANSVGGGAIAVFTGLPAPDAWPFLVASAVIHVAYNLALMASYRLGEFSQTYPIARGTSPWVVALASIYLLHRPLGLNQLLGVLTISVGLIGLVLAGGRLRVRQLPAIGAAVLTGLLIATYTVIDGLGVAATPVMGYIGWLFLLEGVPLALLAVLRRGRELGEPLRRYGWLGLLGGFISLAAYGIVLWAQTSGALAPIAALRESSIVFGALIGALFLGERLGARRSIAAAVVLVGIVLLA
ncbi:MAG TPA: EamA family transporter [Pseudonocardia sp.]|jgi:drug/metabolite transporter (DMT)-like permease|nr:EamA family transporter [Pseudonocardia sp.]